MPRASARLPLLLTLTLLSPPAAPEVSAVQTGRAAESRPAACDPARAVSLVEQQASEAKMIEDVPRRVAAAVRAADVLWPHRRQGARALFAEAFDLASAHFRENEEVFRTERGRPDGKFSSQKITLPDQRFVVLRAVGRRDPAWAQELAARAARETRGGAEKPEPDAVERQRVGQSLLMLAEELWPVDRAAAANTFRMSFSHPASYYLPQLLYKFAETDRQLADALFREALAAYAGGELDNLIYLSPFPFGYVRTIGSVPVTSHVQPPPGFSPNASTQRLYVETLLRAAARRLDAGDAPGPSGADAGGTEPGQIYTALLTLEPTVARSFPQLAERAARLKARAAAAFREGELARMAGDARWPLTAPDKPPGAASAAAGLESLLKYAEREQDPHRRDGLIVGHLMRRVFGAQDEAVADVALKITDLDTRRQFLDHFYFQRGQRAIKDGALDEAARLAERIAGPDQRALLLFMAAQEASKRPAERDRAEQLLEAVTRAAEKAPETDLKARALLGVAHLYAGFDHLRGGRALADAVAVVNRLEAPDLTASTIRRRVEGRDFSVFTVYAVPGHSLDNAFRELGRYDFEGVLAAAYGLDDKNLRSLAIFALAARCLEEAEKKKAAEKPKGRSPNQEKSNAPQ